MCLFDVSLKYHTNMRIICGILLGLVLMQSFKGLVGKTESDQSCYESHQMEEQCGFYAHRIIKPMMAYFDQVNQIINKNNEEMERKQTEIDTLKKEVIQFQADFNNCTSKDKIIKLFEKKDKFNEELIRSLKQQIDLSKLFDKQSKDLKELQAKANLNTEQRMENELESKNQKIRQLELRVMQLQAQNTKSEEDSFATIPEDLRKQEAIDKVTIILCEKQNNQINELNLNASTQAGKVARGQMEIKSQQEQSTVLNAKLNSETQKVTKLEEELQSKQNIIVANEQKVLQLESEVYKTVYKLKEIEQLQCRDRIGTKSGVHSVTLSKNYTFEVLVLDYGWTIIQQRIHGGVDFNRSWEEYKNGFGDFWDGDFFLGLERIHKLTTEQPHELYIQMQNFDGTTLFARYHDFAISSENDGFRLNTLSTFCGNVTDELTYHKNRKFSTYDRDNDKDFGKNYCTRKHHGGWWYDNCAKCNLNGQYFKTGKWAAEGIFWRSWLSLKEVRMMIRPKSEYS